MATAAGASAESALIVSVQRAWKQSPVLDTDQRFSTTLTTAGTYDYFCSLHPKMQGKIIVRR